MTLRGKLKAEFLVALLLAAPIGAPTDVPALEEEALDRPVATQSAAVLIPGADAQGRDAIVGAVASAAPVLLSRYIRVDTTNPPGNEVEGARFLSELLESEGIKVRVLESKTGRANVVARLKAKEGGRHKPIILLSHIDVVPADAARWSEAPYEGHIRDGALYGRGALDAKAVGMTHLLAMVAAKRAGIDLGRDVIFLATADEEAGGKAGAGWMVENHFNLFSDAEYVLTEGGWIIEEEGKPLIYKLDVAEKGPCWFRLNATGPPGHGSRPAQTTATTRLIDALHKLRTWERPWEVGAVVAGYYAAYASFDADRARQFRQLERSLADQEFYEWFVSDPSAAALIHDTLVPNVLKGSRKVNSVPTHASAEIDSRLLPGHNCEDFLRDVSEVIDDAEVTVTPILSIPSSNSGFDNALTRAVERVAAAEKRPSVVLPTMLTGFTDSHFFRDKGIEAYGFAPIVITRQEEATIHAPNERVRADELRAGVVRMLLLLEELSH